VKSFKAGTAGPSDITLINQATSSWWSWQPRNS